MKRLDISANDLTDEGIQHFFKQFVAGNNTIEDVKIHYNKVKYPPTTIAISEAIQSSHSLKALGFKKCKFGNVLF